MANDTVHSTNIQMTQGSISDTIVPTPAIRGGRLDSLIGAPIGYEYIMPRTGYV
jgi:hypothetical protein